MRAGESGTCQTCEKRHSAPFLHMPFAKNLHGTLLHGARAPPLEGAASRPPPLGRFRLFTSANTKADRFRIVAKSDDNFSKMFSASCGSTSRKASTHVASSCKPLATASIWLANCGGTGAKDPPPEEPPLLPPAGSAFRASAVTNAEGLRTSSETWSRMLIAWSGESSLSMRNAEPSRLICVHRSRTSSCVAMRWSSRPAPLAPRCTKDMTKAEGLRTPLGTWSMIDNADSKGNSRKERAELSSSPNSRTAASTTSELSETASAGAVIARWHIFVMNAEGLRTLSGTWSSMRNASAGSKACNCLVAFSSRRICLARSATSASSGAIALGDRLLLAARPPADFGKSQPPPLPAGASPSIGGSSNSLSPSSPPSAMASSPTSAASPSCRSWSWPPHFIPRRSSSKAAFSCISSSRSSASVR
mmetsp:Transcript_103952/g.300682  ORF Transcript_103952/g.300682 Transcript_103952/m.300682 type:complete len:419 (-) Transcript_103952:258-1514(-)